MNKQEIINVLQQHNENGDLTEVINSLKMSTITQEDWDDKILEEWGLTHEEYYDVICKYEEMEIPCNDVIEGTSYLGLNDRQCKFLAHIIANPYDVRREYSFYKDECGNIVTQEMMYNNITENIDWHIDIIGIEAFGYDYVDVNDVYSKILEQRKLEEDEEKKRIEDEGG